MRDTLNSYTVTELKKMMSSNIEERLLVENVDVLKLTFF